MHDTTMRRLFLAAICAASTTAIAGPVDLATVPLISGLTRSVAPNIYFVFDDSASMNSDYMPDSVNDNNGRRCFRNFGYNTIYYNPGITYQPPKNADGTSFANATFNAARNNGFNAAAGTTDLSTTTTQNVTTSVTNNLGNNPFATVRNSLTVTVTQPGHGLANGTRITIAGAVRFNNVTLNGTFTVANRTTNTYTIQAPNTSNASGTGGGPLVTETHSQTATMQVGNFGWHEYQSAPTQPPATCEADGQYVWRWPQTSAERTNYANWYSYYRTRLLMMKSATGRAFQGVSDGFRVGYSAISEPGSSAASTRFLKIARFEGAHRTTWYSRLYGAGCASGVCYTPLRGALSKAGRLYAGKVLTGDDDPVQYSCQQNFTILTTDGYWNTSDESTTYTAKRENNITDVGDADGVAGVVRPYLDAGKYPNSLADIAYYYYTSDLRPPGTLGGLNDDNLRIDVSANNVPSSAQDTATHQHMTTFTLGLGVSGALGYSESYLAGGSADYSAILQGTKNWPNPLTSPLSNSTTVTARIDDLWHAAVNGRGQYLSAGNPDSLVSALQKTLTSISVTNAAAAAAATSSLEPVAGDNYAYVAQYTTGLWYGDLLAKDIDLTTGSLAATPTWSARARLAAKLQPDSDTRTIYTFSAAAANKLKTFVPANLTAEKAAGYFRSGGTNPGGALTQYGAWSAAQQSAATDDTMIGFLRGHSQYEDETTNAERLYRDRTHALGDIVNAAPVFVKRPPFKYTDAGYLGFATAQADRAPTVYVGANDGMLHAFDAATGNERWAYIPSDVVPNLYRLADAGYANNHRYYVDGPITVGDVYDTSESQWRTVLVGGLGRGGKAFYALDVTDPARPKALWEFGAAQDGDMGFSYGNPVITKRASDGKWVVLVTSGYNNTGVGRLFVLDAITGARLAEIVTDTAVTDAERSGIAKINNWVLNTLRDNTTQYVYGGDLSGSLWRFDLLNESSQRLGRTTAAVGNQPITVRPEIARVKDGAGNYYRVVYFGTGRYLGFTDLITTSPSSAVAQAIYAVKDTGAYLGILTEAGAKLVGQTLSTAGDASAQPRTIPNPVAVDWFEKNGWYVTTPVGERVNVDLKLQLGTLVAVSNEPDDDYCTVGGRSWLYALDYRSGAAVSNQQTQSVGFSIGSSIATGVTVVRLPNNKLISIVTQADTTIRAMSLPVAPGAANAVRRMGWREIP